uniref:DUF5659 domain-containing protein n=1 Tax=Rhabditophanes sp. KR3021 TaxID=114890 RepID=A0AC35UCL2_9BILA
MQNILKEDGFTLYDLPKLLFNSKRSLGIFRDDKLKPTKYEKLSLLGMLKTKFTHTIVNNTPIREYVLEAMSVVYKNKDIISIPKQNSKTCFFCDDENAAEDICNLETVHSC